MRGDRLSPRADAAARAILVRTRAHETHDLDAARDDCSSRSAATQYASVGLRCHRISRSARRQGEVGLWWRIAASQSAPSVRSCRSSLAAVLYRLAGAGHPHRPNRNRIIPCTSLPVTCCNRAPTVLSFPHPPERGGRVVSRHPIFLHSGRWRLESAPAAPTHEKRPLRGP